MRHKVVKLRPEYTHRRGQVREKACAPQAFVCIFRGYEREASRRVGKCEQSGTTSCITGVGEGHEVAAASFSSHYYFFFLGGVGGCRARQGPRNGCGEHRQDEGLSKARVVSSRESMLEGKLALGTLVREEKAKEKEGGMR